MATIYDVGKRAAVSVATVSAVINNSSYVSPELSERVKEAIQELGYSPNLLARGLAKQKTMTLGVLVPDIANFFYPEVVRGVEDKAKEAGYNIVLGNSDDELDKEDIYLRLFLSNRMDGIVLVKAPGNMKPELLRLLKTSGMPIVLLDREYSDLQTDIVSGDHVRGGYLATQHLLKLGHRKIGIICGKPGISTTDGRFAGYQKALDEAKITFDPSFALTGDGGIESGYSAGKALLEHKPTAVFVMNHMMTIGFLRALQERKLSTPKDLSIVSYDDFIWSDVFAPHLSCVMQPKYELGYSAAEVLLSRIRKKHKRPKTLILQNSLHVRKTSISQVG